MNKAFYSFFALFDDFSKFCSTFSLHSTLKNHQIWPKSLAKNEEKSSSSCLQPISPWYCGYPETRVLGTRSSATNTSNLFWK